MPTATLRQRLLQLEERVTALERLPLEVSHLGRRVTKVESQILQLRQEMTLEFSAIRGKLVEHDARFSRIDERFDAIDRRFDHLTAQMTGQIEEKWVQTRVLFEEVLQRIALIGEARPVSPGPASESPVPTPPVRLSSSTSRLSAPRSRSRKRR